MMRKALTLAMSLVLPAGPAFAANAFNGDANPRDQRSLPYDPAAVYPKTTTGVLNEAAAPTRSTNSGAMAPRTPSTAAPHATSNSRR